MSVIHNPPCPLCKDETPAPRAKYTPGPWAVERDGEQHDRTCYIVGYNGMIRVADVLRDCLTVGSAERNANAKLIAASPKLLEACLAAWRALNDPDLDDYVDGTRLDDQLAEALTAAGVDLEVAS